jgi:hypothetical protein
VASADINNDGVVDVLDLSILVSSWSTASAEADLNYDGIVNALDLSILISHWGPVEADSPPSIPSNLSIIGITDSSISIMWNEVTTADSYTLERNGSILASNLEDISYVDSALPSFTEYTYRVRAVNSFGVSDWSSAIIARTDSNETPPSAPSALAAQGGDHEIELQWQASSGAGSYTVKRSAVSGGPYIVVANGVTETNYTDTHLIKDVTYYYVVTASNSGGESAPSNEASATTLDLVPPRVLSVTAGSPQDGLIRINFTTDEETTAELDYGTSPGSYQSTLSSSADARGISHTVDITGTQSGSTYYYRLRIHDTASNETISEEYDFEYDTEKIFDVPEHIAADYSVDVTTELQSWIDSVPDGSTIRFPQNGQYWTENPLYIYQRNNLTIEGNNSELRAYTDGSGETPPYSYYNHLWPRKRTHFTFRDCSYITIRNMIIHGGHPNAGTGDAAYVAALEAQHGVEFISVLHGTVENCQIYDVYGDYLYVAGSSEHIVLKNNYCRRNGRQGIAVVNGRNIIMDSNDMAQNRRATIDLEANTTTNYMENIRISNNTTGSGRLLWLANGGPGWLVSNIHITGNTMLATTGVPAIYVNNNSTDGRRGPYIIENNNFLVGGSPAAGFRFRRVEGLYFRNNHVTLPANRAMTAVSLIDSTTSRITNNQFVGATRSLTVDDLSSDYCAHGNTPTEADGIPVCGSL